MTTLIKGMVLNHIPLSAVRFSGDDIASPEGRALL
jgi:hypothetical protein